MKQLLLLSTLFLFAVQTTWAQTSKTIEGVAIDSKGVPLPDGTKEITFNIYDSIDGDTPLWSEQQTVAIKDGRFSASLGGVNSLELPENKTYWLGMKVGEGKELSPRLELNLGANDEIAQNAALVGNTLDMAYDEGGAGLGGTITADAGAVNIAGPDGLTVNGSVGIGTTSPNAPLQVANYLNFANGDATSFSLGLNAGKVNTGAGNSFMGNSAGLNNTTGVSNVAIGRAALQTNVTGSRNMAIGTFALFANTGTGNVAIGKSAMSSNSTGSSNVGLGESALGSNLTGINNMAIGTNSLLNTTGSNNIGIGTEALKTNISGAANTGIGTSALKAASSSGNVAIGFQTGQLVTSGFNNQLLGYQAGDNITTGSNNLIIGYNVDAPSATADNQMSIGNIIFGTNIDGTQTTISTGNIGIGTTTPGAKLDIAGQVKITGGSPGAGKVLTSDVTGLASWQTPSGGGSSIADADNDTKIQTEESTDEDKIRFDTAGSERMIIDEAGNVGIGEPSPAARLVVRSTTETNIIEAYNDGTGAATGIVFRVERETGDVYAAGVFNSGGADVAEYVNTTDTVEPGDVIEIDPDNPGQFRKAREALSPLVAGIITTDPGVVLGGNSIRGKSGDDHPAVALAGRVPVKVMAKFGAVEIGDLLVSSPFPGYAMKCAEPRECVGAIIGKIMVQVMLR